MKLNKYSSIALSSIMVLTSATAFSRTQVDLIKQMCEFCIQIAKPNPVCIKSVEDPDIITFCGSETWDRSGVPECKRFIKVARHCANGSIQAWTEESWAGAGTTCKPGSDIGSHDCE